MIGETFVVMLQMKNRSFDATYRISGTLLVESILYTGRKRVEIKSVNFDEDIAPESVQMIKMELTFVDYYEKLLDQAAFNISCIAKVHEADYVYYDHDDFRVRMPDVEIKLQGYPEVDQEIEVILRLANLLPISIGNAVFNVQGTGLERQLQFKVLQC